MTKPKTGTGPGGEAGYAQLARLITAFYAPDPPIDNRQVYAWATRRTENKDGQPFPEPSWTADSPKRGTPRYKYSVREVLAWYAAGTPLPHGVGWQMPEPLPPVLAHLVYKDRAVIVDGLSEVQQEMLDAAVSKTGRTETRPIVSPGHASLRGE